MGEKCTVQLIEPPRRRRRRRWFMRRTAGGAGTGRRWRGPVRSASGPRAQSRPCRRPTRIIAPVSCPAIAVARWASTIGRFQGRGGGRTALEASRPGANGVRPGHVGQGAGAGRARWRRDRRVGPEPARCDARNRRGTPPPSAPTFGAPPGPRRRRRTCRRSPPRAASALAGRGRGRGGGPADVLVELVEYHD